MTRTSLALLAALPCAGCWMSAHVDELTDRPVCDTLDTDAVCKDIYGGSSSGGTTGDGVIMTTTLDPGTGSGGGSVGDGGSSDGADQPGDADAGLTATLSVSPAQVLKVMNVDVALTWTGPASTVDLYLGDTPLLLGAPPAAALHTLQVTSDDVPGNGKHKVCARVRAIDGRTVDTCADLDVDVTAGGEEDWNKTPFGGGISALTSAAALGDDVAVAGYVMPKGEVARLAVAVLTGDSGAPKSPPAVFNYEAISWSGEASGPALTVDPGGSIYVAATVPDGNTTTRVLHQLDPDTLADLHSPRHGDPNEDATAITLCQGRVVVVGSVRTSANPDRYDLRVWWLSKESGFELDPPETFAAPAEEDFGNNWTERAYGVACVESEVVVVGTREIKPDINKLERYTRTVVLRYAAPGTAPEVWTSPGDVLAEDAALAVAPTRDGGFAMTGWARNKFGTSRQVLTRRFAPDFSPVWPPRPELTAEEDATGRALAEDLEGKLIIAATREKYFEDLNAWIFAAPDLVKPRTWETIYNGPSNGPDGAFGLALDGWGYPFAAGAVFEDLQIRAFAVRLYP